jgi:hypothetical protein
MCGRVLVVFALSLSVACVAWGQGSSDPNQPAGQNTKQATSKPATPPSSPSGLSYVQMNKTVAACLKAIASDKKNKLIVRLNAVDSLAGLPSLVTSQDAPNVETAVVQDLKELLCHALPNPQFGCTAPTNCAMKADAATKADAAAKAQADAATKADAAAKAKGDVATKADAAAKAKADAVAKADDAAKAKADAAAKADDAAKEAADSSKIPQCPPIGVDPNCNCAPCCDFFCSDSERNVFILHVVMALGNLGPYAVPALDALAKASVVDDAVVKGAIMNAQQAILTAPPQTPSNSPSGSGGSQASGATIPLTITISVVPQLAAATPPAAPASGVIIPVTIPLTVVPQQAPPKPTP